MSLSAYGAKDTRGQTAKAALTMVESLCMEYFSHFMRNTVMGTENAGTFLMETDPGEAETPPRFQVSGALGMDAVCLLGSVLWTSCLCSLICCGRSDNTPTLPPEPSHSLPCPLISFQRAGLLLSVQFQKSLVTGLSWGHRCPDNMAMKWWKTRSSTSWQKGSKVSDGSS